MKVLLRSICIIIACFAMYARGADPFADVIRKTDPLPPELEKRAFHLPPGFEAQLVASEPEIGKPMNMAFDARGRLWITQSREYPFPVLPVEKKGRDKVLVLEDFAPDGHARKIHTFVDGLNISIGLYPYQDGVIAFSIPKIHFFQDTNNDGRADVDTVLLSGFGYEKDTHGLTSNFRRGYDGWIYADHGFNNDSTVTGRDGSSIKMNSGNCYRFRPDGTHVEQHSFGQVNPFGLMFDPLGDLWSADCHSSPTYMLMHGAYYPSFGKPNDGLGFAPDICKHSHGSTAISGIVFYDDDRFPQEYRWNTFIGNVMTCKINRDSYVQHGSTRIAKEEPDFLSSDDPWFRPVAIELGPDGALYVADFYNRIIGHYEVPLDHPGRDRERGRIWRIVYTGTDSLPSRKPMMVNLSNASAGKLCQELAEPNITLRMLATDQLVDRLGANAIPAVSKLTASREATSTQKVHGLWALSRLGALKQDALTSAAHDQDRTVRVHVMRILAEQAKWSANEAELVRVAARDADPFVQRAAAEALGRHPSAENAPALLALRASVPADDEQLVYVTRMALRNQLVRDQDFDLIAKNLNERDEDFIADVAVAVKSPSAAAFLLHYAEHRTLPQEKLQPMLQHIARYISIENLNRIRDYAESKFRGNADFQLTLFRSIQEGLGQRGAAMPEGFQQWGAALAKKLLTDQRPKDLQWQSFPVSGADSADPWVLQKRASADGDDQAMFMSSLPGGEKLTGGLRSSAFTIPERLSFYLAGHDGYPDKPLKKQNYVRLRDPETHEVLITTPPPRNDAAQRIEWDLSKYVGRRGELEVVDGDAAGAFAWLAIGRFSPEVIRVPDVMPGQFARGRQFGAELAGQLKLAALSDELAALLTDRSASVPARSAAAKALGALGGSNNQRQILSSLLNDPAEPQKTREACARALADGGQAEDHQALVNALKTAPHSLQVEIALAMAGQPTGSEALLKAVEQGNASPRLLQDKHVRDRLAATRPARLEERLASLTQNLPPEDIERQKLIASRLKSFDGARLSNDAGAAVFKQTCAVCHSLDGSGANVGPQLDGVGGRGAARLMEDILDPSRNVDPAFRVTLFTMKDGDVETGLLRREEGDLVVVADSTGKERSLKKGEILSRKASALSLMPDNFSETIKPDDFNQLVGFLLSKAAKQQK
jgi:putative heme-binding domain-containing protein